MDANNRQLTLSNSWAEVTISKIHNTVDITCTAVQAKNNIYIDNVLYEVLNEGEHHTKEPYIVGYGGKYKITATDGATGTVQCMVSEYSNSSTVNYLTGGDFYLTFLVVSYFLAFFI